jgi:hypothetical protein
MFIILDINTASPLNFGIFLIWSRIYCSMDAVI